MGKGPVAHRKRVSVPHDCRRRKKRGVPRDVEGGKDLGQTVVTSSDSIRTSCMNPTWMPHVRTRQLPHFRHAELAVRDWVSGTMRVRNVAAPCMLRCPVNLGTRKHAKVGSIGQPWASAAFGSIGIHLPMRLAGAQFGRPTNPASVGCVRAARQALFRFA